MRIDEKQSYAQARDKRTFAVSFSFYPYICCFFRVLVLMLWLSLAQEYFLWLILSHSCVCPNSTSVEPGYEERRTYSALLGEYLDKQEHEVFLYSLWKTDVDDLTNRGSFNTWTLDNFLPRDLNIRILSLANYSFLHKIWASYKHRYPGKDAAPRNTESFHTFSLNQVINIFKTAWTSIGDCSYSYLQH